MNEFLEHGLNQNRRKFLSKLSLGIGGLALGSLMVPGLFDASSEEELFTNVVYTYLFHGYCNFWQNQINARCAGIFPLSSIIDSVILHLRHLPHE